MPLNAVFTADFSRWNDALKSAQQGLKSFEVSGKGVQQQLERMAKSFSGVNIKKEADLAAAAVKAIGGASRLTEAEQRKVNATVTEAIAKYRALGQTAPAELRKLQKETANVEKSTAGLGSSIGKIGGLFAGALTVGAVVNLSRKVLQLGGDIADLSAQTGIGVRALQEFKFAGGQVGVGLDQITGAINIMQNRIAEGDKSAVGALRRLNISLTDFKKLKPEDQFAAVAEAIGGIQDPAEKVRTAMDLMGKSGAQLLPVLTTGFNEAREAARQMGVVLDEQTIAALDSMGDELDALQAVGLAGFARLLVEIKPLLKVLSVGVLESGKALAYLQDQFELMLVGAGSLTADLADLEAEFYELARAVNPAARMMGTFDASIADARKRASEARIWVKTMADGIQRDATRALIALAKLGEQRGVAPKLSGSGGSAPSDAEIKRFQQWRDEVTGAATEKALQQLTKDWLALSDAERSSQATRDKVMEQYDKLRVLLPRVGGALEDLRTSNLKALQPLAEMSRLLQALSSRSIPDATAMFVAGQAAVDGLTRSNTLFSRRVVDLRVQMSALPKEVKSYAVSAQDATLREKEAAAAAKLWRDNLEDLAQGFALLAQMAPGALGTVATVLGQVTTSLNLAVKGVDAFMDGMDAFKGGNLLAGLSGMASGILGIASAALALGKAIADLFNSRAEKTVRRIFNELGVAVTEEFAQGIEDTAETIFGGNRQAARIFSLEGLIDQAGGLNSANFSPLIAEFRDLFSMVQTGAFTAAQGIEVLDANFRTFADFVTKGGSLASKELLEIIKLTERTGLQSAEVASFVVEQTNAALGGLTTFLSNVSVKTQAAADGISAALFGVFEAQSKAGVPLADIVKQLDPLIQKLDAQLKAAGLSGGAAFDEIKSLAAVASHEIAGPLITGVLGLEQALAGLHNAGVLNEEMFDGLTASVADTYAAIQATGVDGAKALQLIGPSLQTIWELQEDFGYSVDAATQALLDEAKAAGVVGAAHRTVQEQMLNATNRMADGIDRLVGLFEQLTGATEDFGDAIQDLPEIPSPRDIPSFTGGTGGDYQQYYAAKGGLVPKYLAGGGPSGTDTVPAWLTPGEFVMRRDAVNRIGASNLSAMNSGATSGGGSVTVNVSIQAWDGNDVLRVVRGGEFNHALVTALDKNEGQFGAKVAAKVQKFGVR